MRQEKAILAVIFLTFTALIAYTTFTHKKQLAVAFHKSSHQNPKRQPDAPLAKAATTYKLVGLPATIDNLDLEPTSAVSGMMQPDNLFVVAMPLCAEGSAGCVGVALYGIANHRPRLLIYNFGIGSEPKIEDGVLKVFSGIYQEGDPRCCPHQFAQFSYALRGRAFVEVAKKIVYTKPDPKPVAAAQGGSVQSDGSEAQDGTTNRNGGKIADLPEKARIVLKFNLEVQGGLSTVSDVVLMACGPKFLDYMGSDSYPGSIDVGETDSLGGVIVSWKIPNCASDRTGAGFDLLISADDLHVRPKNSNASLLFLL